MRMGGQIWMPIRGQHWVPIDSRMMFARAYIRESQEMVFDAHDRAFVFFKEACTRGIYDNMKTAMEAIFTGKERQYNRRYLQMCSHYLVQPVHALRRRAGRAVLRMPPMRGSCTGSGVLLDLDRTGRAPFARRRM